MQVQTHKIPTMQTKIKLTFRLMKKLNILKMKMKTPFNQNRLKKRQIYKLSKMKLEQSQ